MAVLQNLKVLLSADTSQLNSGLGRARSALSGFRGAVLGAFGAVGLGAAIKGSLDAADNIQKLSIRIGASTEALSEYRHVAELSGVSFKALSTAWQRQTRRISEAAAGTGAAKAALDELGLSAENLKQMAPEQQFETLAKALGGVENQSDRVRLAMKFWDTEGVGMLQVVDAGADGMAKMRAEAKALGLSLSRDQADGAAAANDAMTKLGATFSGLVQTLTVEFAPALADTLSYVAEWLPKIMGIVAGVFRSVGTAIGGVAAAAVQLFSGNFSGAVEIAANLPDDIASAYKESTRTNDEQLNVLTDIRDTLQEGGPGAQAVAG